MRLDVNHRFLKENIASVEREKERERLSFYYYHLPPQHDSQSGKEVKAE
jgi:hypothetical protein